MHTVLPECRSPARTCLQKHVSTISERISFIWPASERPGEVLVAAQGVVGDVHNVTVVLNNVLTGYHGDALAVQSYRTFNARFHEYEDDIDIELNRFACPVIKSAASLSMISCSMRCKT